MPRPLRNHDDAPLSLRLDMPDYGDLLRVPDKRKVGGVDEDSSYGIFISYVEIYNNFIYDLLEENGDSLHSK